MRSYIMSSCDTLYTVRVIRNVAAHFTRDDNIPKVITGKMSIMFSYR